MGLTILKKKSGYALGVILCIIGVIMLLVLVWKWWDTGVFTSEDVLSALSASFWEPYDDIALGIGLKLIHYTVLGVALLIAGGTILIVRREKIPVVEEVSVLLECPYCKNQWQESMSKAHLESMGYPQVRTLSRRKCSKCAKFVRPKIVTTKT